MRSITKIAVIIKPTFLLTFACALLLFPVDWVLSWLIAAAFHEFCHYVSIKAAGVRIFSLTIGGNGAEIQTDPMQPLQECFIALSGPLGAFVLLFFASQLPRIAVCVCIQSLYNLLPLYPLDGGRALFGLIAHFKGDNVALRACSIVRNILLAVLLLLSIGLTFNYHIGYTPAIIMLFLFIQIFKNNYTLQRRTSNSTIRKDKIK